MEKIAGVSFSHCCIFVTDLDRMVHFYTIYLGFVVSDRGRVGAGDFAFITRDPAEHHQIVMATGRKKGEQPIDEFNHSMDAMRYLVSYFDLDAPSGQPTIAVKGFGQINPHRGGFHQPPRRPF
jgi:catechol 2,3-dioxygenase-like lactoylglutathione lyase family enzyme